MNLKRFLAISGLLLALVFATFGSSAGAQTPAVATNVAETGVAGDVLEKGKPPTKTPGGGHTPVTICHQKGNGGYIEITVDDDGAYGGHAHHKADIIPAPAGGCGTKPTPTNQPPAWTDTPEPTATGRPTQTRQPTKTPLSTPTLVLTKTPMPTATPSPIPTSTTRVPPKPKDTEIAPKSGCVKNGIAVEHYGLNGDREWNIWLFDEAGNFQRDLTAGIYRDVRNPSWSPGGCWFAAQIEISDDFYAIAIINTSGGVEKILNLGSSAVEPEVVYRDLVLFVREKDKQLMFWDPTMGTEKDATSVFTGAGGRMPHSVTIGGHTTFAYTNLAGNLVINDGNSRQHDTGIRCFAPEWYPDGSAVLCHGTRPGQVHKVTYLWTTTKTLLFSPYAYGGTAFNPLNPNEYAQIKFGVFYGEDAINDDLWFGPGSDWVVVP